MNAINGALTRIFDVLLVPLEALGEEFALIMVSGIFGILALIAFKHISSQRRIKAAKDKIKGHMIEIRIYQNDLGLVSRAIGKVLYRNLQYVSLNFGPFIPLAIPFAFVVAQMVVRYGFMPVPIHEDHTPLAGGGTTIRIEVAEDRKADVSDLRITYPDGIRTVSPLVRVPTQGYAYQEIVATRAGVYDIELSLGDGEKAIKKFHAGEVEARWMQPERMKSALVAILWPAERTFSEASGLERVSYVYPESDLGWLPGSGPLGVILVFVVASMAFGFAMLKPLGVQI